MEKIISVKNLRKAYKKSNRFDSETAVENVCFELAPGNIMGLLGKNGKHFIRNNKYCGLHTGRNKRCPECPLRG